MCRELRGGVKVNLWNQPTCADDSEKLRLRQLAHKDFRQDRKEEDDWGLDVASPDYIDVAQELTEDTRPIRGA